MALFQERFPWRCGERCGGNFLKQSLQWSVGLSRVGSAPMGSFLSEGRGIYLGSYFSAPEVLATILATIFNMPLENALEMSFMSLMRLFR